MKGRNKENFDSEQPRKATMFLTVMRVGFGSHKAFLKLSIQKRRA